jgi:hypothetical protein
MEVSALPLSRLQFAFAVSFGLAAPFFMIELAARPAAFDAPQFGNGTAGPHRDAKNATP